MHGLQPGLPNRVGRRQKHVGLVQRVPHKVQRSQRVQAQPAFEQHEPHLRHGRPGQPHLDADACQHHHASKYGGAQPKNDQHGAGSGCVRIVHGKGRYSAEGVPVLKNLVDRLLRQRGDVLAFHSAPAAQGGTGAVLVLLKPR